VYTSWKGEQFCSPISVVIGIPVEHKLKVTKFSQTKPLIFPSAAHNPHKPTSQAQIQKSKGVELHHQKPETSCQLLRYDASGGGGQRGGTEDGKQRSLIIIQ